MSQRYIQVSENNGYLQFHTVHNIPLYVHVCLWLVCYTQWFSCDNLGFSTRDIIISPIVVNVLSTVDTTVGLDILTIFQVVFRDVHSKEGGGTYREILLNRPKALNALNWSMACQIFDHLKTAAEDSSVPMVVIEGGYDPLLLHCGCV